LRGGSCHDDRSAGIPDLQVGGVERAGFTSVGEDELDRAAGDTLADREADTRDR
jgi:hypothetical protein